MKAIWKLAIPCCFSSAVLGVSLYAQSSAENTESGAQRFQILYAPKKEIKETVGVKLLFAEQKDEKENQDKANQQPQIQPPPIQPPPVQPPPVQPPPDTTPSPTTAAADGVSARDFFGGALGGGTGPSAPTQAPASLPAAPGPPTDVIQGAEAIGRATTDVGDLLGKSLNAVGVEVQHRTPIVTDVRVRGYMGGQIVSTADGGFYFPARPDLDTIVSRLDSSIVNNVVVIKGPYTVERGPGFSFIDIETLGTPRYENGFEGHGSTSVGYKTNGEGWSGRQSVWGGDSNWGYRIGWDILTATDYTTGAGFKEPSGYNSQNFDFGMGFNYNENFGMEFKYLRTMWRDVQFPGVFTDLNSLITDAFTMRFVLKEGDGFRATLDSWYNQTRFDGDNFSPSKRASIPLLDNVAEGQIVNTQSGPVVVPNGLTLQLATNGNNTSWGFRNAYTLGRDKGLQITGGWDFRYTSLALNEFDTFFFAGSPGESTFNSLVPRGYQLDPGVFLDTTVPVGEKLNLKAGTRFDLVTSVVQQPLNAPTPPNATIQNQDILTQNLGPSIFDERHFYLPSAFFTADYKLTDEVTVQTGYGFAERPPGLVELNAGTPFLAILQNGGTFGVGGQPGLLPEQLNQVDLGVKANYETLRTGVSGFYSSIHDYIALAYDTSLANGAIPIPGIFGYRYHNTTEASLAGLEAYGEYDLTAWLTPFATLSYVSGRDYSTHQALAGIYPLDSVVGFRVHDTNKRPRWAVEFSSRIVANQPGIPGQYQPFEPTLLVNPTPGFAIFNIRAYWLLRDSLLLTAGIENLTNVNYQEALDLRNGMPLGSPFPNTGVFQPGFNFYVGLRWTY
jgi:iron complex outermembrane recepter protein